jgi:hypothetical protein
MRLLLDDLEHGFATGAHQRRRIDRPHAADLREAEIFLDPLDRPRCCSLEERGSELDTNVRSLTRVPIARTNSPTKIIAAWPRTVIRSHCPWGLDPWHTAAVLLVVESHPIDQSGYNLGRRARPWCMRHGLMIKVDADRHYGVDPSNRTASIPSIRTSGGIASGPYRDTDEERHGRSSPTATTPVPHPAHSSLVVTSVHVKKNASAARSDGG